MKLKAFVLHQQQQDCAAISPRCGHSLNALDSDSKTFILFGGASHEEGPLNDCWIIDTVDFKCEQVNSDDAIIRPSPRYEHCVTAFNNDLLIFGGAGLNGELFNDLWKFDTVKRRFVKLDCSKSFQLPAGRTLQYACVVANRQTGKQRLFLWSGGGNTMKHEWYYHIHV